MKNKSAPLALFLSFVPGLGHFYLERYVRAVLYGGAFGLPLFFAFFIAFNGGRMPWDSMKLLVLIAFLVGVVNMVDMIFHLVTRKPAPVSIPTDGVTGNPDGAAENQERFLTILLSFVPGLGHFHLGLMQRGLVFLTGFFGSFAMIAFIAVWTHSSNFLVFLIALPIIWVYNVFDAVQLVHRKQRGETLIDRSVFEDFQEGRESGRKSKMLATLLSVFPGAGHMYLGLQRRGLQLMAAFLFLVYVLDAMRLTLFLFLVPLLWFYSFFDALQQVSRHGTEPLNDTPIVEWLVNRPRWAGIGLLALGAYYLIDSVALPLIDRLLPDVHFSFWFHQYFQTAAISVLLIGGGLKLLTGNRDKPKQKGDSSL